MSAASFPNLSASDLQAGDVCLMTTVGEVSKLISWVGDCPYSHAFLMYDSTQLVEAALSGIRLYPIAQRLADTKEVLLIDVFRPSANNGKAFAAEDVSAMQTVAKKYVGLPYARNALVEIALMSALRNELADSETLRWVLRIAMSHYLKDDPSQMVCSELVYRVLQEAAAGQNGSLRPTIISAMRSHVPLPPINMKSLVQELEAILFPKKSLDIAPNDARKPASMPAVAPAQPAAVQASKPTHVAARAAYENSAPVGTELDEMANAIRAKHLPPMASAPVLIVPNPNPKTVFPVDLATSPSLRFIGRLNLG